MKLQLQIMQKESGLDKGGSRMNNFYNKNSIIRVMTFNGTGGIYDMNQSDQWIVIIERRLPNVEVYNIKPKNEIINRPDVRTTAEHIENIRDYLNISISELSAFFEVSRQAIYKWLAGGTVPEQKTQNQITLLSRIADQFREANISRAGTLLKMKAFEGRSLMDLIVSGEYTNEHVRVLINEARIMENSYRQSGLSSSKATSTRDWQASISIPGSSEKN